jgi:hypothetical protein
MCIKFIYICKENGPLGHFYKYGANQTCTSLRCTGQCPVPSLARPTNRQLSRKTQRSAAIIHQTVRCAPDCLVSPRPTVDFTTASQWLNATATANGQKVRNGQRNSTTSSRTRLSGMPPDCPVRHRGWRIQRSTATSANG